MVLLMIKYTQGNLLEAPAEALVNTVNTVGVMGKGIALMFKERFAKNTHEYTLACKENRVQIGRMFITETDELIGPRWVINFPTKENWRRQSQLEWIEDGLQDLKRFIVQNKVQSVAIPPLGAGNGGLDWSLVRTRIEQALSGLEGVQILVFEPTDKYRNVAKKTGVKGLTAARALMVELIRRYEILGIGCSLLEAHKLAWFLQRVIIQLQTVKNPLQLEFEALHYGPYADKLRHLLDKLDGHYLRSDKRIADSSPLDVIRFNYYQKQHVQQYLETQCRDYLSALEKTTAVIDGFESPFGLELLATIDWLVHRQHCEPEVTAIEQGIRNWPAGKKWADRKARLFDQRIIGIALDHLKQAGFYAR